MGLFGRFRSAGYARAGSVESKARVPEEDALRLIDEGDDRQYDPRLHDGLPGLWSVIVDRIALTA